MGCEVYLVHRSSTMAFAAGMVAFPGGGQEPVDTDARACATRELAEETGVRVSPDALLAWDRWITPEAMPIRYDTSFFVALLPDGQEPECLTSEAEIAEWVRPAAALAAIESGQWSAFPPTRSLLADLAMVDDIAEFRVRARARGVRRVLAPNAGPMTLDGTNTWLLPTMAGVVVVDPGPADPSHFQAVLAAADELGGTIGLVVLTHRHHDHVDLVPELVATTGATVRSVEASLCHGAAPLADGEELPGGLIVMLTPGHTDDSICLYSKENRVLLTGDTVLGRGSSVIMYGDGSVTDSLASLTRLADFATEWHVDRILPGHGPEVVDPVARLRHDLAHRRERISQVQAALDAGLRTVDEVTQRVHAGLDPQLAGAARTSIAAHLEHLGRLSSSDPYLEGSREVERSRDAPPLERSREVETDRIDS